MKRQKTRHILIECKRCGCKCRTAQKWIDECLKHIGPMCPNCLNIMEVKKNA